MGPDDDYEFDMRSLNAESRKEVQDDIEDALEAEIIADPWGTAEQGE